MTTLAPVDTILDLTSRLWQQRDSLSLDQVDGAFYWRICRFSDFPRLDNVGGFLESPSELQRIYSEFPDWEHSLFPESIPRLRGHWIRYAPQDAIDNQRLLSAAGIYIGIQRKEARGVDFANIATQWEHNLKAGRPELYEALLPRIEGERPTNRTVYMSISFHEPETLEFPGFHDSEGWPRPKLAFPCIVVRVSLPLPPRSVLEAFYDAYAIEMHGFHNLLPSAAPNSQTVIVAIRTWAISCLMASGPRKLYLAFGDVEPIVGHKNIPGERVFQENKAQLLQRVPEASRFLSLRGGSPSTPQSL